VALPRGGVSWDFGKSGPAASGLAGLGDRCGIRGEAIGAAGTAALPVALAHCRVPNGCTHKMISSERFRLGLSRLRLIVLPDGALAAAGLGQEMLVEGCG